MKSSYSERYPDVPVTLTEQLDRCARLTPDKVALVDQTYRVTWAQLRHMVNIAAAHLLDSGICPGDRVLIGMERRFDLVVAFLAVARAGGISVPFDFKASAEEQHQLFMLVKPAGGIYHQEIFDGLSEPLETTCTMVLDNPTWKQKLEKCISDMECDLTGEWDTVEPDTVAYLNMTSGSTGRPKAAIATYRQLFANTLACVAALDLSEDDVHLPLFAVMSHPHEIFCRALFTGATIVLVEKLYPRTIVEMIQKHHVTCMMAVSAVYKLLLPFFGKSKYDLSSLRLPESGGMPTPTALNCRFSELTSTPIIPVWGSTETMGIAFYSNLDGSTPENSVGKPLPGYHVRIVDKDNFPVASGEVGELQIKGSGVMSGYYEDPVQTAKSMIGDWYQTGDLFESDAQGNYYFRGRMDAMIKAGGMKIYPAEIEAALFSHPQIHEAVVVPFDDRLRGLVPMAVIVTEPGESVTEAQLRSYLSARLAKQKMPRIYRFLPDLPRIASGKIDRKALLSYSNLEEAPTEVSLERRLDAIDLKILHLLNERMRIELDLMQLQDGIGFQPERIQEIIRRILEFNPGPLHDSIVENIFRDILSLRTLY